MADVIEKRLRKLESQLGKLSANFDSLRGELDSTIHGFNKEVTELYDADAEIAKKVKVLDKISKAVSDMDSELASFHEEIDEERKSFGKELSPLFDADAESKKKFRSVDAVNRNTSAKIDAARTEIANVAAKLAAMEKSWNINVIKRTAGTIADANKALAAIDKRDSKNVRNLDKVQAGIFSIAKHASDIEAEHLDAKMTAKELAAKAGNLKDTMDYFLKQSESLNSRINSNAAGLTEIADTLEVIKNRILELEDQSKQLAEIKETLDQNSKNIDQLVQKVAYLEKATVKTIVLD